MRKTMAQLCMSSVLVDKQLAIQNPIEHLQKTLCHGGGRISLQISRPPVTSSTRSQAEAIHSLAPLSSMSWRIADSIELSCSDGALPQVE